MFLPEAGFGPVVEYCTRREGGLGVKSFELTAPTFTTARLKKRSKPRPA
jgi:hypothetical protein